MRIHRGFVAVLLACVMGGAGAAPAPWLVLPPVPALPKPAHTATIAVNGIHLWYAEYGRGEPIILLHGGLADAAWWGLQIPALAQHYRVIVPDSRGQGRSTNDPSKPISYALMAEDVVALMDHLQLRKAAVAGWSDGAITGLDIAIAHPERLSKLFAFGANTTPAGYHNDSDRSPAQIAVVKEYVKLMASGYARLSPTPQNYAAFDKEINRMWDTQPQITAAQLQSIRVPTWIVDGDHDEIIRREDIDFQFANIPDARELIVPGTSHFAFLQAPALMNDLMLHFMAWKPDAATQ